MDSREKLIISEDVFDFWENQFLIKNLYNVASQSSIENGFSALDSENLDNIMIINSNKQFLEKFVFQH